LLALRAEEPLFTPPNALPEDERLGLGDALGRLAGAAPAEGRAPDAPVEGRAPAAPVEGRAPAAPVEGRAPVFAVGRWLPPEPQPRASLVLGDAPLVRIRFWSGFHCFEPPVVEARLPDRWVARSVFRFTFLFTFRSTSTSTSTWP
jgi:hypothetical protein